MSDRSEETRPKGEKTPAPYEVGYKRPPVHSRFQKGRSGNPKGRPRGAKNKPPSMGEERLKAIIKEEAYREVEVTERGETVTMPIAQLALRSLAAKAAKGDHRSQRLITELVATVESQDRQLHFEHMRNAMDYKDSWNMAIAAARRRGEEPPNPLPHPDDILVCPRSGEVSYLGPMSEEEAEHLARVQDLYLELDEEIAFFAQSAKRARDPERKAKWQRLKEKSQAELQKLEDRFAPMEKQWPRHWPPRRSRERE